MTHNEKNLAIGLAKASSVYVILCVLFLLGWSRCPKCQAFYPLNSVTLLPIILFFSGLAIRKIGTKLVELRREVTLQAALIAVGLLLVGFALWNIVEHLNMMEIYMALTGDFPSLHLLNIAKSFGKSISLAISVALSIPAIALCGEDSESSAVSGFCKWISSLRIKITMTVIIFVFYFTVIHSVVPPSFQYLGLANLALMVVFGGLFFISFRREVGPILAVSEEPARREDYLEDVESIEGEKLVEFEKSKKLFVEKGIREDLLVRLVALVQKSKVPDGNIPYLLSPIINYQDDTIPTPSTGWMEGKVKKRNRKSRKKVLEKVVETLEKWGIKD